MYNCTKKNICLWYADVVWSMLLCTYVWLSIFYFLFLVQIENSIAKEPKILVALNLTFVILLGYPLPSNCI